MNLWARVHICRNICYVTASNISTISQTVFTNAKMVSGQSNLTKGHIAPMHEFNRLLPENVLFKLFQN